MNAPAKLIPIAGRIPPHDLDAEAAVLSALMLERTALDQVVEFLRPEHFYSEANRRIYEAAVALSQKSKTIDMVSLSGELRDRERLTQVGGSAYLVQIIDAVPSVANLAAYGRRVHDKFRIRQIIATCQRIAAEGYGDVGDESEFLAKAEHDVYEAAHLDEVTEEKTLGECAALAYKGIEAAAYDGDKRIRGVRTHLHALDRILGGLREGKLTILAAAPGVGKSMLAQTIAINAAKRSNGAVGVQVFSPEMTDEEIGERAIASEALLDSMAFRCSIDDRDWGYILAAVEELHRYPIWVTDDADVTVTKIRARVRRRQQEFNRFDEAGKPTKKLGVVIVDYLQLLNTQQRRGQSREEAVGNATRELKLLAKGLRVHVIVISSLNRTIAQRVDKRPLMSDLRESGAIEFHADNILFLYRESYYDAGCLHPEVAELNVAKQRGGPTGLVKLHFTKGQSRFDNLQRDEPSGEENPPHWQDK